MSIMVALGISKLGQTYHAKKLQSKKSFLPQFGHPPEDDYIKSHQNTNQGVNNQLQQVQYLPSTTAGTTLDGPTLHIFQPSPPGRGSAIFINRLMGLFEPHADYTYLISKPALMVYSHVQSILLTTTILTKTNVLDIIALYQIIINVMKFSFKYPIV